MPNTDNQLHHVALIIDELKTDLYGELLSYLKNKDIEVLSLYADPEKVDVESLVNVDRNSLLPRVYFYNIKEPAQARLIMRFKDLVQKLGTDQAADLSPEELLAEIADDEDYPQPDFIIKVGGDLESLENTVTLEASYAEIYFFRSLQAKDFTIEDFSKACADYGSRQRNFGA